MDFFSTFSESTLNIRITWKKDEPQRLFVSEIIVCKKQGYLNAQNALCQNTYGQSTC